MINRQSLYWLWMKTFDRRTKVQVFIMFLMYLCLEIFIAHG